MSNHVLQPETPTVFAVRTGLAYNRTRNSDLLTWDDVLALAVGAYWRARCGLPARKARRAA